MTWEEQLKVEKGMTDKIASLIKRMKDASFERKIGKFLKKNLTVEYASTDYGWKADHRRTTDRDESIKEAKELFLDIVEKAWDRQFPETYETFDSAIYADDAP